SATASCARAATKIQRCATSSTSVAAAECMMRSSAGRRRFAINSNNGWSSALATASSFPRPTFPELTKTSFASSCLSSSAVACSVRRTGENPCARTWGCPSRRWPHGAARTHEMALVEHPDLRMNVAPHIGSRELSALRTLIRRWRELCECLLEIDRDRNLVIQRSGSLPRAGDHRVCGPAKWKSPETVGSPLIMSLKPAMRFCWRLYTIIGNDQGEWPPDDDVL